MTTRRIALRLLAAVWTLPLLLVSSAPREPEPEAVAVSVRVYAPPPKFYIPDLPLSRALQEYTFALCERERVDYELALAVMWSESRFTVDAVNYNDNGTCDSGLMQINDVNSEWMAQEYAVTDLMDAKQNIRAGVKLLGELVGKYGEHDALLAYNLGETGMMRARERGVETTDAVDRLLEKRSEFEQMEKYR